MVRLLVALDFSDCSRAALRSAFTIAANHAPTKLILVTVLDPLSDEKAQTDGALSDKESAVTALHKMVETELAATFGGAVERCLAAAAGFVLS